MIRSLAAVALLCAFVVPACAQQPSPDALKTAIGALQQQRNQAMDAVVEMQIQTKTMADENAKLKAEIEDLKKKIPTEVPK